MNRDEELKVKSELGMAAILGILILTFIFCGLGGVIVAVIIGIIFAAFYEFATKCQLGEG